MGLSSSTCVRWVTVEVAVDAGRTREVGDDAPDIRDWTWPGVPD